MVKAFSENEVDPQDSQPDPHRAPAVSVNERCAAGSRIRPGRNDEYATLQAGTEPPHLRKKLANRADRVSQLGDLGLLGITVDEK